MHLGRGARWLKRAKNLLWWIIPNKGGGKDSKKNSKTPKKLQQKGAKKPDPKKPNPLDPKEIEKEIKKANPSKKKPTSPEKKVNVVPKTEKSGLIKICGDVKIEEFPSITAFIKAINSRAKNDIMKERSDSTNTKREYIKFCGTENIEEAYKLLRDGYPDILDQIKEGIDQTIRDYLLNTASKSRIINDVVGAVPNVPKALMNLPESMMYRHLELVPSRTLHITYLDSINGGVSASSLLKAGIKLLSIIKICELNHINVRLDLSPYSGRGWKKSRSGNTEHEIVGVFMKVKDYSEKLNLLKLCFPVAHPSMFRRIGFRWLETSPLITCQTFAHGYGYAIDRMENCHTVFKEVTKDSFVVTIDDLIENKIEDIIKLLAKHVKN